MATKPVILTSESDVPADARRVEAFTPSLEELFFVRNPHLKKQMPEAAEPLREFLKSCDIKEIWIYYNDQHVAVRTVPEEIYFELRTARNRMIITPDEQRAYRGVSVGIAGLSVGSAIVRSLVMSGGPQRMKIADFDTLEVTNLNRLNATLLDVGMNKTDIAAQQVWELDPFAELSLWNKGIAADTLSDFLAGDPKLDIFIDEMDSIDLKIKSRLLAKTYRLPVLMATDNGDGVILDVERFDEEPDRAIFHGLINDLDPEHLGTIDFPTWVKLATRIVGPEYLPPRMKESIASIGKTISAIPQLGTSAEMAGAAIAYAVRAIANHQTLPSGRYTVSLEEKLNPQQNSHGRV